MRRVVIIGTAGSGKTTLGTWLAAQLGVSHVELDALHWEPGWAAATDDLFRARVAEALAGDAWVVDGNYAKARDLIWPGADTIVWLDMPLAISLWRIIARTVRRVRNDVMLWRGNRESYRSTLFARDGLLWWAITSHSRHRRQFERLLEDSAYAHLHWVRLRTPRQVRRWMTALQSKTGPRLRSGDEVGAEGLEPPTSRM